MSSTSPDLQIVPTLVEKSIINSLKIQVSTDVKVKTNTTRQVVSNYSINCLSTLGMKSSAYTGILSLAFPEKTYLELLHRMIGEKYPAVDPNNSDGSSEILNIIYANARKDINAQGFNFEPAIPSTIVGKNLELSSSATDGNAFFFEVSSDAGAFLVILGLKGTGTKPK